ncbi:MAG: DUF2244 domain-containing protein [Pseudomonadota bacterium]
MQSPTDMQATSNRPVFERRIEGYRSLPKEGFAVTIAITMIMLFVPMFAVLGTPVLWGLLPPALIVIAALWFAIRRNTQDGTVAEEIRVWKDHMHVTRFNPRAPQQDWQANPHWVKTHIRQLREVENYLTLTGGNREIEVGRFLTPDARLKLRSDLDEALRQVKAHV